MRSDLPSPHMLLARRGEQWVGIDEVPRGLSCNCRCWACGEPVVARKGNRHRHHFAHYRDAGCQGGSGETLLHQWAKWVLVHCRRLRTPPVYVWRREEPVLGAKWVTFDEGEREFSLGRHRIDVLLSRGRYQLGLEVKVSHGTPPGKIRALVGRKFPCLEVDVAAIYTSWAAQGCPRGLPGLVDRLYWNEQHKKWLFHPFQHQWEYRRRQEGATRQVHHGRQGGYHHYWVYGCPRKLRFVSRGFREGQAYARVLQDCLHCRYCQGIAYETVWSGYREWPTFPREVHCVASEKSLYSEKGKNAVP